MAAMITQDTCTRCRAVIFRDGIYWTAPSQPWPINCRDVPGLIHVPANASQAPVNHP